MQFLAKLSVKRPVFATVLILLVCVIGLAGYAQLGVDRFPKVDFPTIAVITRMPGAAPEEVETEISQKIEEAVNSISGIDQLKSISSEGVSQVLVTFVLEKDADVAAQEVRDKLGAIAGLLPKGIDPPLVRKFGTENTPVLQLALDAKADVRAVTEVADKSVRRALETVSGVGKVEVLGGTKRQINVQLDVGALRAHDLTALDVQRAIARDNVTTPGGRVESGPRDVTLRVRGRVESPAELAKLAVKKRDGSQVLLGDLGRVEDGAERASSAAYVDGKPAVLLAIGKQSGANTVAVVDAVNERISDIQKELPAGYALRVVRDESRTIRTSVHAVTEHLVLGGILSGIVVLLFLGNLRSTVIAAVAIPVSIVGTFALMWAQGFTLDTITLLALALSVGIVIDDAIVVLENVVRHIEEKGLRPFPAAVLATREIGLAVLATTLSLIAVFLPVAFMSGIVGKFLKSFGMTMSFAIAVSLLVSFTLTPMMSARWLRAKPHGADDDGKPREAKAPILTRFIDRGYKPIERAYVRVLAWVMQRRWIVVGAAMLTLGSCVPLSKQAPKGFLPKSDEARFELQARLPEGTSLEATTIVAERLAREVRKLEGVSRTVATIGSGEDRKANVASIYVGLVDPEKRALSQEQLMDRARREIAAKQPDGIKVRVFEVSLFGGDAAWNSPIAYVVAGAELDELGKASTLAADALRKVPGAVDVDTSLVLGKPELSFRADRDRAAELGVDVADVASTLQLLVGGADTSSYVESGETYRVHLRAAADQRRSVEDLELVTVPSAKLGAVRLLDVVKVDEGTGPSQIERLNRRRQVLVTANVAPGVAQGDVQQAFDKVLPGLGLPRGYAIEATGNTREMARTGRAFLFAFGLSFVFMYLILAAQFESWIHPVTILLSLPLTVPFALISIIAFGQALDIYSSLGILVLFGVVKKNAILQIDHTLGLRRAGMPRLEAILQANKDRLRPILMTTIAFVAGMIPLVTSTGIGAGYNRATAGVIVGGQTLSLVLTLLVTPVAYSLFDDAAMAWQRLRARLGTGADDDRGEADLDALGAQEAEAAAE
jgi:hydrophobe/amphiphile efflux-1 (HAE1) family protein